LTNPHLPSGSTLQFKMTLPEHINFPCTTEPVEVFSDEGTRSEAPEQAVACSSCGLTMTQSKILSQLKTIEESLQGIVNSNWRNWAELGSPEEFERWTKSRAQLILNILSQTEKTNPVATEGFSSFGVLRPRAATDIAGQLPEAKESTSRAAGEASKPVGPGQSEGNDKFEDHSLWYLTTKERILARAQSFADEPYERIRGRVGIAVARSNWMEVAALSLVLSGAVRK
jgi:hypothetical protein